ncbi:MAG: alpha-L-fucosidase [Phycisphaerales bacterium]|nr:MAG: alpha-L-fucosidase [Phycisphaerales bacterium]
MKKACHLLLSALLILGARCGTGCSAPASAYEPDWQSLKRHQTREWSLDAKFGIYTHWGHATVGADHGPAGEAEVACFVCVEAHPSNPDENQ